MRTPAIKLSKNLWVTLPVLIPAIYVLTVMWWIPDGSKYVLGIVALSVAFFIPARLTLKTEAPPQPKEIRLISIMLWAFVIYSSFIYLTDGDSWKQLKAFIAIAIYSLIARNIPIRKTWLHAILFISGSGLITLSLIMFLLGESRVGGFINPVPYATAVSAIMLVCFMLGLLESKRWIRNTFRVHAGLLFIALLLTQTRGVIIPAIFLLIVIYFAHSLSSKGVFKTLVESAVIITLASLTIMFVSGDRIERTAKEISLISEDNYRTSIGLRLIMWDAAIKIWKQAPITGVGDTHLETLNDLLEQEKVHPHFGEFVPSHYHNQYLNELVMKGAIGLIIFLALILSVFYLALKNEDRQLKWASLAVISIYLLSSLSNVPFKGPDTIFQFFMLIYALSTFRSQEKPESEAQTHRLGS